MQTLAGLAEVTLHRRKGNRTAPKDRIEIWVKGRRGGSEVRIPGNVVGDLRAITQMGKAKRRPLPEGR